MTTTRRSARRGGYTLLEVLLATAIALFLLAGLYVALDVTLVRMDISRDQVATNDLGRAVVNRIASDLQNTLGPLPPMSGGDAVTATSSGSAAAGAGSSSSTGEATGGGATGGAATGGGSSGGSTAGSSGGGAATGGGSSSAGGSSSTGPADSGGTDAAAAAPTLLPFGMGVVGTADQLMMMCSRVPATLVDADAAAAPAGLPGDLRRVIYYLASDGSGLCRQERPWVTAAGVGDSTEPDRSDEAGDLIAPEVVGMVFEYFDGSAWAAAWDGAVAEVGGGALTGPPRAVRVTLTLQFPGQGGVVVEKLMTHTIPVRAAVGGYTGAAATTDPAADPAAGETGTPEGN